MKVIITTALLITGFCIPIYAGFMDWYCKTPGGNEINDFSGFINLEVQNRQKIERLKSWYFYKNYIIGKTEKDISFFIFNENTLQITNFNAEQEWKNYIEEHDLNPKIWKRCYRTDWTMLDEAFLWFFYGIPLLLLLLYMIYRAIKFEQFNIRKPYTIAICLFIFLILVRYILEQYPQSI